MDWNDLQFIRDFFKHDRFATDAGAVIDWVKPGEARCSLELGPQHQNAAGILQGGVAFTLADFAFAVAANVTHPVTVSLNNQIAFLRPPKGAKLIATAKELSAGKTTCYYEVEVTDEFETSVAHMTVTGYIRSLAEK
ncbi:MAG: PaaI family thioesterase [Firmicutes bacterium]|nr:PaaI family thioesterase [Bacillota bacterium]